MDHPLLTGKQHRKLRRQAAHKKAKADRRAARRVQSQLREMGVEQRAHAAIAVMRTDVFKAAFLAAREAHGPYEGVQGYEELRQTLTALVTEHGADMTGLTFRFMWNIERQDLDVMIAVDQGTRAEAEARAGAA